MTRGYKRHGTTTLFAAPNILDGSVIGQIGKNLCSISEDAPVTKIASPLGPA
jgi:hypothetical protein